jgi:hypothetical protein
MRETGFPKAIRHDCGGGGALFLAAFFFLISVFSKLTLQRDFRRNFFFYYEYYSHAHFRLPQQRLAS